jgi:hypothetical protein
MDKMAATSRVSLLFRGSSEPCLSQVEPPPLAALMQEKDKMAGKRAGVVLSGRNIDRSLYLETLAGQA